MSTKVVHTKIFFTTRAVSLFAEMDALNVVVQQVLCLELCLTVGATVVPDLFMEVPHMTVEVLKLFMANVEVSIAWICLRCFFNAFLVTKFSSQRLDWPSDLVTLF